MKKLWAYLSLVAALTVGTSVFLWPSAVAILVAESGCATANQTAYKTTGAVYVSVDAAMKAWGNYVSLNHPPVAQEIAVRNAFEKYRAAALVVTSAGAAHARVLETQGADPATALSTLNAAISISASALGDLLNLMRTFGAKI